MKLIKYIRIPLLAFILFGLLAGVSEKVLLSEKNGMKSIETFVENFKKKQVETQQLVGEIVTKINQSDQDGDSLIFEKLSYLNHLFEKREISVLVTSDQGPVYWTDNVSSFFTEINSLKEGMILLPNGWYYHTVTPAGKYTVHGLILIKHKYKFRNDYLHNRFAADFSFPRRFEVIKTAEAGSYPIFDQDNHYQFSIKPSGSIPCKHSLLLIPFFFYLLSFIGLLIILYRANAHLGHRYPIGKSLLLLIALLGIYLLMNRLKIPESLYLIGLFSPQDFAFTSFWTSLGELLVFSALLFFWSVTFSRSFNLSEQWKRNVTKRKVALLLCLLFLAVCFVFVRFMIYNLVMNSTVSFALYRVEDLSIASIYGFLVIGFLILFLFFISVKMVSLFRKELVLREYAVLVVGIFVILYFSLLLADRTGAFRLSFFFLIVCAITYFVNQKGVLSHRMIVLVIYVLVFTLFVLINLNHFINLHESKVQETMAINLSTEHDPTAEVLLKDVDERMMADPQIPDLLSRNENMVERYLIKKYFGGYFREYDLQITLCREEDSLVVKPDNITQPCFAFFDEMTEKSGLQLQGTHFYFMENTSGRITYFGHFEFLSATNHLTGIFIELNSKLLSEGVGFPELLLPQNSVENRLKNIFSFAKYNGGQLVDRGGDFTYALSVDEYQLVDKPISFDRWGGYEHCIYCFTTGGYVIVSRRADSLSHYLVSFPYFFVFFFLIALILSFASKPSGLFASRENSLRNKIQFSIIGVVFASLLIVGAGTIYYIVSRYNTSHQKDLTERINSVSVELGKLAEDIRTDGRTDEGYLNSELMSISDVFHTDINLFGLDGTLLATSRPEIFEKGLISRQMDHVAFQEMSLFHPSSFMQKEHIGDMEYLSAYVPLIDESGEKLAYLNLPYFAREKEFRQEVTTFILAFINIYVFLLLASILVAYFISVNITNPLRLIRENLQKVHLGKNPEPIQYYSKDEIGLLVSEYNHKVEELANSAELLARSERESAWREMAKQIAHEIKNPLTPMKLNIQFLQRTDPKTDENYNEVLKRVTNTIIEQIDNLSAIATEFSNFAKMPKAKNEVFNLCNKLEEIVGLYNYSGECELVTSFEGAEKIEVMADKEQFSRAMINLIRNAIQSIPDERKGKIVVEIVDEKESALVKVSDNGKGIPEPLKDRIFLPNFTTKSSGAGLGLAITKSIVENFRGEIWFTSQPGEGTTFFMRIPLVKK